MGRNVKREALRRLSQMAGVADDETILSEYRRESKAQEAYLRAKDWEPDIKATSELMNSARFAGLMSCHHAQPKDDESMMLGLVGLMLFVAEARARAIESLKAKYPRLPATLAKMAERSQRDKARMAAYQPTRTPSMDDPELRAEVDKALGISKTPSLSGPELAAADATESGADPIDQYELRDAKPKRNFREYGSNLPKPRTTGFRQECEDELCHRLNDSLIF